MSSQGCSGCEPRSAKASGVVGWRSVASHRPRDAASQGDLSMASHPRSRPRSNSRYGSAGLSAELTEWSDSDGCLTGGNAELVVPAAACASNSPGCRCCPRPRPARPLPGLLRMCASWTAGAWRHRRSLLPIHWPIEAGAAEQPPIPQFCLNSVLGRDFQGSPKGWHFVSMTDGPAAPSTPSASVHDPRPTWQRPKYLADLGSIIT